MTIDRIKPHQDLNAILHQVENPARYVGGEYGQILKDGDSLLRVALTFPELYEIGMSNTAIKLIYGMLNAMKDVACERVFVPAPDFEAALRDEGVPLYTLESGRAVRCAHVLAVSYGYELLATNFLTILKSSGIPVDRTRRTDDDPIVLVGGPGATNPGPIAKFCDGIFVGEAEAALPLLARSLAEIVRRGGRRSDLLACLRNEPTVWTPDEDRPATRAVWSGFGRGQSPLGVDAVNAIPLGYGAGFPVPSIPVVHDHGPIEIMRGCPQGCRFCHAGVYYRPYRMKPVEQILTELRWLVEHQGYRDITLSSLSSGDYSELIPLLEQVNALYRSRGISFQLPSLRVNSFTLPILEELSQGRKSGLTFAVEAARESTQLAINKLVSLDRTIAIAREARSRGWQHAKLYFMIGLPESGGCELEAEGIIEYVRELRRAVKMEFVVNVGTFVPKPHTPFQWERQTSIEEANGMIDTIRSGLPRGTRLRAQDPWMSWLESLLSRGDKAAGRAVEVAHEGGARLDAWGEHLRKDVWDAAVAATPGSMSGLGPFDEDSSLPWDRVDTGVTSFHLRRERDRARHLELSGPCEPECGERCGVCNREVEVRDLREQNPGTDGERPLSPSGSVQPGPLTSSLPDKVGRSGGRQERTLRMVVRYAKHGPASFIPHLGLVRTFERIWQRVDLPLALTEGYHPKARMSFGQPLPLGIPSDDEIVVVAVQKNIQIDTLCQRFNACAPAGLTIRGACLISHEPQDPRIPAPMQVYGGAIFRAEGAEKLLCAFQERLEIVPGITHESLVSEDSGLSFAFTMENGAPGLGRVLKMLDEEGVNIRGQVGITRVELLSEKGGSLFSYYQGLRSCLASSQS